jgi:hypothetical protein
MNVFDTIDAMPDDLFLAFAFGFAAVMFLVTILLGGNK